MDKDLERRIRSSIYHILVGFGLACAPVRCAHPSFWAHCYAQLGAARPPAHRSYAAPLEIKIDYFQNKMSSFRPELGPLGAYIFSLC